MAQWLRSEPGVELRGDVQQLAASAVRLVVEVFNGRHVLVLHEHTWRLEHDLRCRIGVGKWCPVEGPLRVWLKEVGRPPHPPGRYVVGLDGKRRGQETPITLKSESE
jgi:hypothetical protein